MAGQQAKKEEKTTVEELTQFTKDSVIFFNKCTRPDKAEFMKIL